jgi:hypothetical protein
MKRDATPEVDRRTWLARCARTVVLGGIGHAWPGPRLFPGDDFVCVLPGIVAL